MGPVPSRESDRQSRARRGFSGVRGLWSDTARLRSVAGPWNDRSGGQEVERLPDHSDLTIIFEGGSREYAENPRYQLVHYCSGIRGYSRSLLCWWADRAVNSSVHEAGGAPGTLLVANCSPGPEPPITTP